MPRNHSARAPAEGVANLLLLRDAQRLDFTGSGQLSVIKDVSTWGGCSNMFCTHV